MRVAGIDPSSSNCGVALVVDGKLESTDVWKKDKNESPPEGLWSYFIWLWAWLIANQPDMACVEFLSVEKNAETTRKISHYQAVSALACKLRGIVVVESRVTTARKHALGKGNLSKEDAWKQLKEKRPHHQFKAAKSGGYDEADAAVLAIAGPAVAES